MARSHYFQVRVLPTQVFLVSIAMSTGIQYILLFTFLPLLYSFEAADNTYRVFFLCLPTFIGYQYEECVFGFVLFGINMVARMLQSLHGFVFMPLSVIMFVVRNLWSRLQLLG